MKCVIAAAAVLALAGSSNGFVFHFASVQPESSLVPSVGGFQTNADGYGANAWLTAGTSIVTDARVSWKQYSDNINGNTWLGIDPRGGAAGYSYVSTGPGADPVIPYSPGSSSLWLGHAGEGLQPDGSAVTGGSGGVVWSIGFPDALAINSEVSPVNGESIDSVFVGHFVFTEPGAILTGADLLVHIGPDDFFVPLDGSPGTNGYRLEYERGVTAYGDDFLDAFIVPGPGWIGLLAMSGVAAGRRRRPSYGWRLR